ncbi:uncharacterized protein V1513DRAFT_397903 [Lipomyces chichibuensis]|uniref:uncharacterized protein n=1 Tax=Lipomyces chichibuensis TaxID=1546026 RepID=UPI003342FDC1
MDRKAQPFPAFDEHLPFSSLLYQIELHIARTVDSPYSYEQLRGPPISTHLIRPLVRSLEQTRHPAIIAALLAARIDFSVQEDDRAIHEARAYTAELVALRYAGHLPEAELIQYLTYEIPRKNTVTSGTTTPSQSASYATSPVTEATSLLEDQRAAAAATASADIDIEREAGEGAPYVTESAMGLSALELAILGNAKKFLLSRSIENVVSSIWEGRIVFWDSISVQSKKKASFYNPRRPGNDWYSRLRVPKYRMFFMMVNYAVLLALYYAVLTERNITRVTALEIALDVWFAGFVYEEIGQVRESGSIRYYASDYWSAFDLAMIVIFLTFFVVRVISVFALNHERYAHAAFDVLSLEALLLVPRVFSSLAISPYFGTLLPCLKQMTKDFLKVLVLIVILYVGFLTTFSFLGRDHFTVNGMAWLLIRCFFGAPYDGLDAASEISPIFGPPLMLVFVILTNVLLITVVISILSQRFGRMMNNANEEYMLLFASSVMESITTSDRVTYFYPPLNLIGILIRPIRLFLNHNEYRNLRIYTLKVTHAPFVALLWIYETVRYHLATSMREKHSSLLHLRSVNGKKRLWTRQYGSPYAAQGRGGRISQGLLVANQVILSGTEPELVRSVFGAGEDGSQSKPGNSRNDSYGRANGIGVANKDVAKRRKTRKSAIVAKQSTDATGTNRSPVRPPLASSAPMGSIANVAVPDRENGQTGTSPELTHSRATTFSTPQNRDRYLSGISGGSDSAHLKQIRRSKIAISLLRDLRRRRSVTLPAMASDARSEVSDVSSMAPIRHDDGAKALAASHTASEFGSDEEEFKMSSLPSQARSVDSTVGDGRREGVSGGDGHDYLDVIDDEVGSDIEDVIDDEDDDDDDDDFIGLYADQSNLRIRGLEEQVYKMKEMLEQLNAMLVENMQRQRET